MKPRPIEIDFIEQVNEIAEEKPMQKKNIVPFTLET